MTFVAKRVFFTNFIGIYFIVLLSIFVCVCWHKTVCTCVLYNYKYYARVILQVIKIWIIQAVKITTHLLLWHYARVLLILLFVVFLLLL